MSVPGFLIWHCAGCGAPAVGKAKPCDCPTNAGVRDGPNGQREQTWWNEPEHNTAYWHGHEDGIAAGDKRAVERIAALLRAEADAQFHLSPGYVIEHAQALCTTLRSIADRIETEGKDRAGE